MKKLIIPTLIIFTSFTGCELPQKDVVTSKVMTEETSELLNKLKDMPDRGYMIGHQDAKLYGTPWEFEDNRSDIRSICGDYPAMIAFEIGDIERGIAKRLVSVPFSKIREEAINHYKRGGVVSISWHANNPKTGSNSWDITGGNVVETILEGGEHHASFISNLDIVADFFNSLISDEGVKVPVLFRPWHEHTGSWFWWGKDHCTSEQYKQLWDLTYRRMSEKGVDNILYAYSSGSTTKEEYIERYPSDEYIDLLGFDCYQVDQNPESYKTDMNNNLIFLTELSKEKNKPIAITETGFEGISDKKWWTEVLAPICEKYPVSYVLVWRNAREIPEHYYAPFPGHISESDFVEFYKSDRSLFCNDIQ